MCYIFDSFVYNKVRTRKRVFVLSDGNNFSLGRKHFSLGRKSLSFGMCSGCVRDGLVLDGQVKRTRFAFQKDSFYSAKGLVLKGKMSPFLSVEC